MSESTLPYVSFTPRSLSPKKIFDFVCSRRDLFHSSPLLYTGEGPNGRTVDESIRRSKSFASREIDSFIQTLALEALSLDGGLEARLGLSKLRWPHTTGSCIAYNDGDFVAGHNDFMKSIFGIRVIGCLYYFHREPKSYSGGEFLLTKDGFQHVIEPSNGTFVLFPAELEHEVIPLSVPSKKFEDSRFVLAGFLWDAETWMRYTETKIRKTLSPYASVPPLNAIRKAVRHFRKHSIQT